MRRVGDAWIAMGDVIVAIARLTGDARAKALAAIEGRTREALSAYGVNLDGDLDIAARTCYSLGEQLIRGALHTEFSKYVITLSLAVLVGQLVAYAFVPGVGQVSSAAATSATRVTVRAAVRELIAKLGADGALAAAGRLGKAVLTKGVTLGAIQGGATPLLAGGIQMARGDREWWDHEWTQVGLGVVAGGAGGWVGDVVGGRVMAGLERVVAGGGGTGSPFLGRAVVRLGGAGSAGGAGAVAGVLAVAPFTGSVDLGWGTVLPGLVGGVVGAMPQAFRPGDVAARGAVNAPDGMRRGRPDAESASSAASITAHTSGRIADAPVADASSNAADPAGFASRPDTETDLHADVTPESDSPGEIARHEPPDGLDYMDPSSELFPDTEALVTDIVGSRPPTLPELRQAFQGLAEAHPDLVAYNELGQSRSGYPMELLSIRSDSAGDRPNVLLIARTHANEQIGDATALALAHYAVARPEVLEEVSFHIWTCSDPDAAMLCAPWPEMEGPVDLAEYHRSFYRPVLSEQPDWSFPTPWFDSPLPETRTLMQAIDTLRPVATFPLHNSDSGGSFLFVDSNPSQLGDIAEWLPDLFEGIVERHGLRIDEQPLDSEGLESIGPGAIVHAPIPDHHPGTPTGPKSSSAGYAVRYGGIGINFEVPQWNTRQVPYSRAELTSTLRTAIDTIGDLLGRIPAADIEANAFGRAAVDQVRIMNFLHDEWSNPAAEVGGIESVFRNPLRAAGLTVQLADQLLVADPGNPGLLELRRVADGKLVGWAREAEAVLQPTWRPLSMTAGCQLEAILGTVHRMLSANR